MKSPVWLRIAAVIAFVNAAGHSALFVSYRPTHGPMELAVIAAMKANTFSFGGFLHSYWEMYFGYGLFVIVSSLVEGAILWLLAGWSGKVAARPMIAVLFLGEVGYAALMWKYFFLIPIVSHTLLVGVLGVALITAERPVDSR